MAIRIACSALVARGASGLAQMRQVLKEWHVVWLSLSLYWFWQLSFFQSPFSSVQGYAVIRVWSPTATLLACSLLTYLAVWTRHAHFARLAGQRRYLAALGLVLAAGTAVFTGFQVAGEVSHLRAGIHAGAALMGVGAPLLVVEYGRIFAQLGPRHTLVIGTFGSFAGTVLCLLFFVLPSVASAIALTASIVAAVALLARAQKDFSKTRLFGHGLSDAPGRSAHARAGVVDKGALRFPHKLAATCALQGFALGCMATVPLMIDGRSNVPMLYIVGFLLGGIVLLMTALTLKMDFNHLVYQIGMPIMGLGFLLVAWSPHDAAASSLVLTVGYCFTYTIVTCIISYFTNCLVCSPGWIVSLATFFLVAGQLGSTVAMSVAATAAGDATSLAVHVAAGLAFALPTGALILMSNENPSLAWGAIKPGTSSSADETPLFRKIASDHGLSNRETEVVAMLARGRNKKYVSQELGVSEETVKTHMGNIYRKLQIHSHQELIDLVERERSSMRG